MDFREKLFQKIIGPFDAEMQVKAMVAGCFIRDGSDLLELFWMGWKSDRNNRSYRAKLFVNLRMAIECFLKGLIIVHSDNAESPEDAYKAARKHSHSLASLHQQVQTRSKWKRKYCKKAFNAILDQIDQMKVGLRYEIDLAAEYSKETFEQAFFEDGPMSGTVSSDQWLLSLFHHAAYLGRKARKAFRHKLDGHTGMRGSDAEKRSKRIKLFLKNIGLH